MPNVRRAKKVLFEVANTRAPAMTHLEDLKLNASVRGILPNGLVTVVSVQWFGSEAIELTYKDATGKVGNELLYRDREADLEIIEEGRPWSFDGDGALFRLVSEAQRIHLAHLFDPVLAVHTSVVEPLPHQITAVYEACCRASRCASCLPTILAPARPSWRASDQGADRPRRPAALPRRLPRKPRRAVAGRALPPFQSAIRDPDQRQARSGAHRQLVPGNRPRHRPARQALLATKTCRRSFRRPTVDGTSSSATRRTSCRRPSSAARSNTPSATGSAQLLSTLTRHFLLMTATPHNGKEEDFQLFMALLDGDRFEGKFRDGVHVADVSDLMRRMVKESLLKFDATRCSRSASPTPCPTSSPTPRPPLQSGDRVCPRGVQSRRGAGERQARRDRRLRAHHSSAPPRVFSGGDLPVASPSARAA